MCGLLAVGEGEGQSGRRVVSVSERRLREHRRGTEPPCTLDVVTDPIRGPSRARDERERSRVLAIESVPSRDLLNALEPAVTRGLERHLSATTEWFPHEYVPYEVGRNYVEEPWESEDSDLEPVARTALEVNLLTEDNLPYYHLALWDTFGRDGAWGEWSRRWTAEEGRHAIVLRDYLTVTRGVDPVALERGRMDQIQRGWYPSAHGESSFPEPLDGVVYTTIQELATRIAHRNTGVYTKDPLIERLTARIATDENLHYVFYRDLGAAALEIDPSRMMLAIERQILGFEMPGLDIPAFKQKAIEMAKVGIYDLRIHRDEVVMPVLFKHWKIDQLEGLSDEAQRARDAVANYLSVLDAMATHYEEKRASRVEASG
jgi:acyl-[acyl-carrier-protein] desaturase